MKTIIRIASPIVAFAIASGTAQALDWTLATGNASWVERGYFGSLQHNGLNWVMGGSLGPGRLANDVWISSDLVNWTVATTAAPWSTRYVLMSLDYGGNLWVMGGGYVGTYAAYNDVWSSSDGVNWTLVTAAAQWTPRQGSGLLNFQGKMWLLGGVASEGSWVYKNDVWNSSDGANWTLVTNAAPWGMRASSATVVFDGKMWIMGGWDGSAARNDVWNSADGVNWTQVTSSAAWGARGFMPSVVFNNKMWIMGGWTGSVRTNDIWSSADGASWNQDTNHAPWTARAGQSAAISNEKLWVLGGEVASYVYTNDVWSSGPVAPEANVLSMRLSPVEISWQSTTNVIYQPQYQSDITVGQWTNLGAPIAGDGTRKSFTDAFVEGVPRRFYRVAITAITP